ncbi:MAG: DUF2505 domain-containing protein [Propionibacteriaceae bacterium]|nr:DUF2505 domain-containing protein [Propionibacteriaceae bacterium]
MRLSSKLRFLDDAELVCAMLVDSDFEDLIALELEATEHSTVTSTNRVATCFLLPVSNPAVATLVGNQMRLVADFVWTGPLTAGRRLGQLDMTVERLPVKLTGLVTLSWNEPVTEVVYDSELEVKIPFVGRRVERAAAETVTKVVMAGQRLGQLWLSQHGGSGQAP